MIKEQLQEIIEETVKRSILRDSFAGQLDEKDLLSVIESNILLTKKKWGPNIRHQSGTIWLSGNMQTEIARWGQAWMTRKLMTTDPYLDFNFVFVHFYINLFCSN